MGANPNWAAAPEKKVVVISRPTAHLHLRVLWETKPAIVLIFT